MHAMLQESWKTGRDKRQRRRRSWMLLGGSIIGGLAEGEQLRSI